MTDCSSLHVKKNSCPTVKKWEPGPITKVRASAPNQLQQLHGHKHFFIMHLIMFDQELGHGRSKLQYKIIVRLCHCLWNWFFVWTAPRMQEIAFLSLRKSKIFWGSMPPDLPPSQKCLGQSKILVTCLTVPVTFASAERSFSKLKLLKTVMRSVMNQERLGELLTLACERDLTDMHDRSRRNR
jgi:hypothetical protein